MTSNGIDDSLQGLSSDPYNSLGTSFGLRIPPALTGVSSQPRFEFCLVSRVVQGRTKVRGIRQLLTIGIPQGGSPPIYPVRCLVQTPFWRFIDGNVSWHLVKEPVGKDSTKLSPTDTTNWTQGPSGTGSAMLYETFTNTTVDPVTGAPVLYFNGLTAYTPPPISASRRQPIAGCGNLKTISYPWNNPQAWDSLEEEVTGDWRISLYASVLQSNPVVRPEAVIPTTYDLGFAIPEEVFLASFPPPGEGVTPTSAPIYWDIGGAILFEDEEFEG